MSTLLLILGSLVLLFSPLESYLSLARFGFSSSLSWNFWGLVPLGVLLVLYWVMPSGWLARRSVAAAGALTVLLTLVFFLGAPSGGSVASFIRLLALIWSVPLIVVLTRRYGGDFVLLILVLVVTLQSLWGVWQFAAQADLGLHFLGETHLALDVAGVAKFRGPDDVKLLRAYGPYPHANSLAGAIAIALIALGLLVRHRFPLRPLFFAGYFLLLGLAVTFSRTGWLAGLLTVSLILFDSLPLKTLWNRFHTVLVLSTTVTLLVFTPLAAARLTDSEDQAVAERSVGAVAALAIIAYTPWWHGVGLGQYSLTLERYLAGTGQQFTPWQIAPIHSVPVLAVAEWGRLVAAVVGLLLLWWGYRGWRSHWWYLLPLLPLLLFDHYLLTQTAPLLLLLVLLVAGAQPQPKARS